MNRSSQDLRSNTSGTSNGSLNSPNFSRRMREMGEEIEGLRRTNEDLKERNKALEEWKAQMDEWMTEQFGFKIIDGRRVTPGSLEENNNQSYDSDESEMMLTQNPSRRAREILNQRREEREQKKQRKKDNEVAAREQEKERGPLNTKQEEDDDDFTATQCPSKKATVVEEDDDDFTATQCPSKKATVVEEDDDDFTATQCPSKKATVVEEEDNDFTATQRPSKKASVSEVSEEEEFFNATQFSSPSTTMENDEKTKSTAKVLKEEVSDEEVIECEMDELATTQKIVTPSSAGSRKYLKASPKKSPNKENLTQNTSLKAEKVEEDDDELTTRPLKIGISYLPKKRKISSQSLSSQETKAKKTKMDSDMDGEEAGPSSSSGVPKPIPISSVVVTTKPKLEVDTDAPCHVCGDMWQEDNNSILFCDKCNVSVHQACYGIKTVPEGEWFCDPCAKDIDTLHLECRLCSTIGGAYKVINSPKMNSWGHIACAWWIPGLKQDNGKTKILNYSSIEPARFKLKCQVCKIKKGAPIQCQKGRCPKAFHPLCARSSNFNMEITDPGGDKELQYAAYCAKHSTENTTEKKRAKNKK